MDELPEGIDSKFRYVLLVAKRAEQLIEGAAPKSRTRFAKPTTVAMHEVDRGMIRWQVSPPAPEPAEGEELE